MLITVYATNIGAAWSTRQKIWDSGDIEGDRTIYGMRVALDIEKAGSMEFTVSPGHVYYDNFVKMKTILTVIADEDDSSKKLTIFRGRISQIDTDIFKQKKISAEESLAFLNDSIYIPGGKDIKSTPRERFVAAINNHNSQMSSEPGKKLTIGRVSITTGIDDSKTYNDNSYSETSSYLKSELIDQYGGFFFIRYNSDYSTQTIDWLEQRDGANASDIQKLVFGKNIVELSKEDHTDDLFTVLVPSGNDNLTIDGYTSSAQTVTIKNADGTKQNVTVQPDGKYLKITSGVSKYGLIYKSESFPESSKSELLKEALDYISNNYHPTLHTFKIKAIDWHHIDSSVKQIRLGDLVTVVYDHEQHSEKLMCSAIDYDLIEPENTEYTLGLSADSLSKKRDKEKKNEAKKSRKTASSVSAAAVRASAIEKAFKITDKTAELLGERTLIAKQVDADLFTGRKIEIAKDGSDAGTMTFDSMIGTLRIHSANYSTNIVPGYIVVNASSGGKVSSVFRVTPSGKVEIYDPVSNTVQDLFQHQHEIKAEELSAGKIRITLGDVNFPEIEGDNHADFDIASTSFYKAAMADAKRKQSVYDIQYVSHNATFTNGVYGFTVSAKSMYDTGEVDAESGEPILAAMSGTNPDTVSFIFNPEEAIEYGKTKATFSSLTFDGSNTYSSRVMTEHIRNGSSRNVNIRIRADSDWTNLNTANPYKYAYFDTKEPNGDYLQRLRYTIDTSSLWSAYADDRKDFIQIDRGSYSSSSALDTVPSSEKPASIWTGNVLRNGYYSFKVYLKNHGSTVYKWYYFYVGT